MTLVAFLRGVNVGGHRRLQPSAVAAELRHLEVVNIGATGVFVVHGKVTRTRLHAEIARRLPFATDIAICAGRDIVRLLGRDFFAGRPVPRDVVRFVSILPRAPRQPPPLPMLLPARGRWMVRLLARDGRFVIGEYRREMQVLRHLGALDDALAARVTTRNWNTITAIAEAVRRR